MQVRHLPNRDRRRSGVATLKCASAHVPRFLTGSDPPISNRQLPSCVIHSTGCFYRAQAGKGPGRFFSSSPFAGKTVSQTIFLSSSNP